jgi:hypothetical protein
MIIIFWEMTPCGSYKNHVISQKMIIIIVTAVETSNLTNPLFVCLFERAFLVSCVTCLKMGTHF